MMYNSKNTIGILAFFVAMTATNIAYAATGVIY